MITTAQAQQVFERYVRENASADMALDDTVIREVQTGVLLKESLAEYQIYRRAKTKDSVTHFTKPHYLIPADQNPKAYPRFFVVVSKWMGHEDNRASPVVYFVQPEADAPWKATAETWAVTEPAHHAASKPSPTPAPTKGGRTTVTVRPKQLPEALRDSSGTVRLSSTATSDRGVCDRFADYLSFTPPHGRPIDERFTQGGFTSDLVQHYNGWASKTLKDSFTYKTTGTQLPVLRLTTGSSLVACTFTRTHHTEGNTPNDTVKFDKGSDTDVLLGGEGVNWHKVDEVSSMTALIEVPAGKPSAATVLSCDCYDPQLLSATGARTD